MKEKWNWKRLTYLMLLIVVFSLGLTAIIVTGLIDDADGKESKYWFFEESVQTGKSVELKNAYVYTNAKGNLEFLYDNITYTIDGKLEEAFSGIADIVVDGEKISKVKIKPDTTVGTLYAYDYTTIQVLGDVVTSLGKMVDAPVYKISENGVVQSNWNEMIVGTSLIKCIMEKGQVCSIVIEESLPSDIRVVIKNGSTIFYENLYIKKGSDDTFIDVKKSMKEQGVKELVLFDDKGFYLCDKDGEKVENGAEKPRD